MKEKPENNEKIKGKKRRKERERNEITCVHSSTDPQVSRVHRVSR